MKTKITSILFLLLLSLIGGGVFAQVQINAPLSYQPSSLEQGGAPGTYKVDIINNTGAALTGTTFSLKLPAGMEYVAGTITGATQANVSNLQSPTFTLNTIPIGNTLPVTFSARINCGYSTPTINYSVLQGSTPLVTASSAVAANTLAPAYVLTEVPAPQILNTSLKTNAFRTIKFKNSGSIGVNTVYIESIVTTAAQYSSYKIMSADHGTVSPVTNGYRVTLTGAALQAAVTTATGAANTTFDPGEEITVVLTEQVVSCAAGTNINLNMKAGSGDTKGNFCFSDGSTASITTSVGSPSIDLTRVTTNSVYPTFCSNGKISYTVTNLGTGSAASALHDLKLPWSSAGSSLGVGQAGIILNKVIVGGVDVTALVLKDNGTGSTALIAGAGNVKVIDFSGLSNAPGGVPLLDLDGDGHFDDLMPGQNFQIDFEYGFDVTKFPTCSFASGSFSLGTSYKDQCGTVTSRFNYAGYGITGTIQNTNSASLDKALFNLGDKSNINLSMAIGLAGAYTVATVPIKKVLTIVLPDALDFDPTGLLKYGTVTLPSSVFSYSGKTLTITLSSTAYSTVRANDALTIPVIATSTTAVNKTITYKGNYSQDNCSGISFDYSCASSILNYGFVGNCPIINTTSFNVSRTTFGFVPDVSGTNKFYRPTAFVNENTPGVNLQGAVSKDKVRFTIGSVVNSTGFNQLWARVKYTPSRVAANLSQFDQLSTTTSTVIGVLKVKKASDGTTLTANITVGDLVTSYDAANALQIMQVNAGAKIGTGLAINYNPAVGDEISINWEMTVSRDNSPSLYSQIPSLQGEFYTKDSGGVESNCEALPYIFYIQKLNRGNGAYYGTTNIAGDKSLSLLLGILNGNDGSNTGTDKFPNEVRTYSNMVNVVATLPGNWVRDETQVPYYQASGNYNLDPSLFVFTYTGGNTVITFKNAPYLANGLLDPASTLPAIDFVGAGGSAMIRLSVKAVCVPTGPVVMNVYLDVDNYITGQDMSSVENTKVNNPLGGINYVNYKASAAPTLQNVDGIGSTVTWQIKVTNTTDAAAMTAAGVSSDLPNNWMSFVSPNNNITVTKLVDISTGTEYPVINYGTGKYWVKLGSIATAATYNVIATYTACTNDKLNYTYSFGPTGYPIDPDSGYGASVQTCNTSQTTADLNLFPKDVSIEMQVASPASPVQFCTNTTVGENPINYTLTVTNTGSGNSEGLVMQALFPEAYGAKPGTSKLTYDGITKTISDPLLNAATGMYEWKISTDPNGIPFLPGAR